jgi:hypothetical protein
VHEAPVPSPSEAEIQALAAERARQAHQDKLNAAIPGRKFRDQKKRKPGALTPGILSATHNAKSQVVGQPKGKVNNQKVQQGVGSAISWHSKDISSKIIDNPIDKYKLEENMSKGPP